MGAHPVSDLLQDIRFGLRTLWKSPGFTIVALLTLALGIGANAAIFSYIDGIMLRPIPYPDPDRMVRVLEKPPGGWRNGISTLNYLDWARENTVFEYLAAQRWGSDALTGIEKPVQIVCERVSVHFFDVFGTKPALGRAFVDGEDQVGKEHEVVMSHAFWVSQYGADPGIIGRTIDLNSEPYTVIGVLPEGAFDRTGTKMWRPLSFVPENMTRDFHWFGAWAKLKPGISIEQATTRMDALAARIAHDFPKSNKGWGVGIDSFKSVLVADELKQSLYMLMGAVGMVLLIACANLANLTLARGSAREHEVAIRAAIGAGRGRLVRQFLTESLIISIGGGALGVGVAYAGLAALKANIPSNILPPSTHVEMDGRVLLFILVLSVATGLIFGLVPAMKASRPDLTDSIRQAGHGTSGGRRRHGVQGTLVVAEVALAFVLLSGAGLLIRSFFKIQSAELGFDSTNVVTAYLPISDTKFHSVEEFTLYMHRIEDRIASLPGVQNVALTSALPMQGWGYGMPFQIEGTKDVDPAHRPACFFKMVTPNYLRTLRMKLIRGRFLDDKDKKGSQPVTVINETMVKKFFPGADPIGKRILIDEIAFGRTQLGAEIPWEVVGIVADEKVGGPSSNNDWNPGIYVTSEQSPQTGQALVVRCSMRAQAMERSIESAIHEINRDQTVDAMKTLEEVKVEQMSGERIRSILLGIFAAIALLLSAIGLYGVISYSVTQRTREIGIRTALGATSGNIMGLVLRSGLLLTGLGLVIGVAGALGFAQVLASMLFNIGKYDPLTLVFVAGVLVAMAGLACYLPTRRALKVNPIVALRYE